MIPSTMPAQHRPATLSHLKQDHFRVRSPIFLLPLLNMVAKDPLYKEANELNKLLGLLNTPASKQQLPSLNHDGASPRRSLQWPVPQPQGGAHQHQSTEALALEQFSLTYQNERKFSKHQQQANFSQIFSALVKQRLGNIEWTDYAPPENILRVLTCIRIMMRDSTYQKDFFDLGGTKVLSEHLQKATDSYLAYGDGPFVVDILKEMTNIFQKLTAIVQQRDWLVACGAHKALVLLLSANDVVVLHCSLYALIRLTESPKLRSLIAELNSIEMLLRILQDYDTLSKKLAANLLRALCGDATAREMIKVYEDSIPLLLSQLHSDNIKLLWNVVWCLVQLTEDPDMSNDIRLRGGIPLLLSLLHDRKFVSDRITASGTGPASASSGGRSPAVTFDEDFWELVTKDRRDGEPSTMKSEEMKEHILSLKSACCTALTELVLNDTNAQQIVQANGIYSLGLLIFPPEGAESDDRRGIETLQANAFRALRFLFSMERNRGLFKRLFPPDVYEVFIDIGHYNRDINAYKRLVNKLNSLPAEVLDDIKEKIQATNHNKAPSHYVQDYAVMELLGSGAFGSVYKVKKKNAGPSYLAMKEIHTLSGMFGKNSKERDKSVGDIISELTIIREQLKHPNVVRYYKTFIEQDKLYIVMELIEGAPLYEHFNSLKEKGEKFSEERVWHIFIQMVLALRYLHKEKRIVHRDLTPNNIMLGENDKVTITDFGLAKQKQKDCSKMLSVVGTILYSCPELLQNQPYGEKADVWAIGCILYQMCTLKPPFYSNNMLSLATKIVEADFEPVPDGEYSDRVTSTIKTCITASPDKRPDIVQLAAHISDIILVHMDRLHVAQINMEKKLERERKRTQRHYYEANRNMQNYHRLFLVSQERYDKLVNLASSGGGQSMKEEDLSDGVFIDQDSAFRKRRTDSSTSGGATSNGHTTESEDQNNNDNGWASVSDEETTDACSSGSESRDSSASLGGRIPIAQILCERRDSSGSGIPPRPPGGTPRSRRKPRHVEQYAQALTLEIPTKISRDSGLSSGDPSPNNNSPPSATNPQARSGLGVQRSFSNPNLDTVIKRVSSGGKARPSGPHLKPIDSATTATLTISPRKVRQINDPILQLLHLLHKIIYITQLPPTLSHNPRRSVIERFKRALFAPQSTSFNLKNELKKLVMGSRELIDLTFGPNDSPILMRQASLDQEALSMQAERTAKGNSRVDGHSIGVTYEQMQAIIESVLVESGYYDMSPKARDRTQPLAPIGVANEVFASTSMGLAS